MELPGLPRSCSARRPVHLDAESIFELVDACDRQLLGRPDSTVAEIRELMDMPRSRLDRDHWLVEWDGRAVGWGCVMDEHGGSRVDVDVYVHPDLPQVDRVAVQGALFAVLLDRLADRARGVGELIAVAGCIVGDAEYELALAARGFAAKRRFSRMRIDLTPDRPFPLAPPGVELEPFDPDADWEEWHRIYSAAFADHWGHKPISLADYRASINAMDEPELDRWRFARVDGRRAGVCQASGRYTEHGGGWILNLGVLREARGRGAGRYLLEHALASYAVDGRTWAGLGVDTENVTGALRLYESVGMTPALQIDAYERQVVAGRVT
ncbi:MAG TPA: GNAT family N-acetyltransferase [Jiangellaceae bacterium]|nr:GNAT family N-acetyltransferase [Jiangellaceae bacterium]